MADPFIAEIRILPSNFAPQGWAFCNGQLLPLSQNTALFSILGTTYGGNGTSNFALPNFQGKIGMHPGQGPGLSLHDLGEEGGAESVTLLSSEIPSHSHAVNAKNSGGLTDPNNNMFGTSNAQKLAANYYAAAPGTPVPMAATSLANMGGSQPHNNLMPYLALNFCIALQGVFPPRG